MTDVSAVASTNGAAKRGTKRASDNGELNEEERERPAKKQMTVKDRVIAFLDAERKAEPKPTATDSDRMPVLLNDPMRVSCEDTGTDQAGSSESASDELMVDVWATVKSEDDDDPTDEPCCMCKGQIGKKTPHVICDVCTFVYCKSCGPNFPSIPGKADWFCGSAECSSVKHYERIDRKWFAEHVINALPSKEFVNGIPMASELAFTFGKRLKVEAKEPRREETALNPSVVKWGPVMVIYIFNPRTPVNAMVHPTYAEVPRTGYAPRRCTANIMLGFSIFPAPVTSLRQLTDENSVEAMLSALVRMRDIDKRGTLIRKLIRKFQDLIFAMWSRFSAEKHTIPDTTFLSTSEFNRARVNGLPEEKDSDEDKGAHASASDSSSSDDSDPEFVDEDDDGEGEDGETKEESEEEKQPVVVEEVKTPDTATAMDIDDAANDEDEDEDSDTETLSRHRSPLRSDAFGPENPRIFNDYVIPWVTPLLPQIVKALSKLHSIRKWTERSLQAKHILVTDEASRVPDSDDEGMLTVKVNDWESFFKGDFSKIMRMRQDCLDEFERDWKKYAGKGVEITDTQKFALLQDKVTKPICALMQILEVAMVYCSADVRRAIQVAYADQACTLMQATRIEHEMYDPELLGTKRSGIVFNLTGQQPDVAVLCGEAKADFTEAISDPEEFRKKSIAEVLMFGSDYTTSMSKDKVCRVRFPSFSSVEEMKTYINVKNDPDNAGFSSKQADSPRELLQSAFGRMCNIFNSSYPEDSRISADALLGMDYDDLRQRREELDALFNVLGAVFEFIVKLRPSMPDKAAAVEHIKQYRAIILGPQSMILNKVSKKFTRPKQCIEFDKKEALREEKKQAKEEKADAQYADDPFVEIGDKKPAGSSVFDLFRGSFEYLPTDDPKDNAAAKAAAREIEKTARAERCKERAKVRAQAVAAAADETDTDHDSGPSDSPKDGSVSASSASANDSPKKKPKAKTKQITSDGESVDDSSDEDADSVDSDGDVQMGDV
jgi:hypothetical protein